MKILCVIVFIIMSFRALALARVSGEDLYKEIVNLKLVFAGEVLEEKTTRAPWAEGSKSIKVSYETKIKVLAIYKGENSYLGKTFTFKYFYTDEPISLKGTDEKKPLVLQASERYIFYVKKIYQDDEIEFLFHGSNYGSLYNKVEECKLNAMFLWAKKEFKVTRLSGEKGFGECPPTEFEGKTYFKK